jgi:hypothetical protein
MKRIIKLLYKYRNFFRFFMNKRKFDKLKDNDPNIYTIW